MTDSESKGGKPNPGTPKDRRLAANRANRAKPAKPAKPAPKKPAFPGAATPFKPKASPKPKKG